jgi:hypothetical protein
VGAAGGPVLGIVLAIVVGYGVDQGVKFGERQMQLNVQNAIAAAAGPLDVGKAAPWQVPEDLPLFGRSGTVQVARSVGEAIPCKDVVFTVGESPEPFFTTICEAPGGAWRWATAEPSVGRWGTLQ